MASRPLLRETILAGNGGAPGECWLWQHGKTTAGYGTVTRADGRTAYTHRLSYETHVGPIPAGLHLDHLCRVPLCWNPAHLEPVTNAENVRRQGVALRRTHCPKGHEYAIHARPGRRSDCAVCHRLQERARAARRKANR